jgi:hypothetical protein
MKTSLWSVLLFSALCGTAAIADRSIPLGRASLAGRVVYEDGRPAAGIPVMAFMQKTQRQALLERAGLDQGRYDVELNKSTWKLVRPIVAAEATTGDDGRFQFNGLTSAPYNIVVAKTDGVWVLPIEDWVAKAKEGVVAKEGEARRITTPLVLMRGSLIRGKVIDRENKTALRGVQIAFTGPHFPKSVESAFSAKTDIEGRFELRVPPGVTRLYACGPPAKGGSGNDTIYYAGTKEVAETYVIGVDQGLYEWDDLKAEATLDGAARKWDGYEIVVETKAGKNRTITLPLRQVVRQPRRGPC